MTQSDPTDPIPGAPSDNALADFANAVNKRAGRDMFAATGVALGLLLVVGAALVWFPWGFAVFVAAAVAAGQVEIGRVLAKQRGVMISYWPVLVGSVVMILAAYGINLYRGTDLYRFVTPSWFLAWTMGLTAIAVLGSRLRGPLEGYVADVTSSLFLLIYPCLMIAALMYMLAGEQGSAKVAIFILAVASSDTGGHLVGVLLGKHPFAPRISPKKSWEGVAGSVAMSVAAVIILTVWWLDQAWWKGAVLAVVIVVFGILGDLVESVIKRDLGIKDMGTLLPGHGGVMDRVDSYVLAAVPGWLTMLWLF